MKYSRFTAILALTLLATFPAAAAASSSKTFDAIMKPYEDVRLTLVGDSMDGIVEHAVAIRKEAEGTSETNPEARALLPKVTTFAEDLAAAEDLATVREVFYELSKVLVQYRSKLTGDDLPLVLYCPMAKKSWLQLEEKVGNPYHGKSMETCGNVVGQ